MQRPLTFRLCYHFLIDFGVLLAKRLEHRIYHTFRLRIKTLVICFYKNITLLNFLKLILPENKTWRLYLSVCSLESPDSLRRTSGTVILKDHDMAKFKQKIKSAKQKQKK